MALDFLSSATGNPINLKRRIAFQTTRGLPPGDGRQAEGKLTIGGSVSDGDTVTIGAHVYEFDTDDIVDSASILVDVSGGATAPAAVTALVAAMADTGHAAKGYLSFSGTVSDTETVTIGTDVYEFDTGGGVTGGRIAVDVSGGATAADAVTALVAAITASAVVTVSAEDVTGNVVKVTYDTVGTAGNAIVTTTTASNGAWDAATLLGGVAVGAKLVTGADGPGNTVEVTAETAGTAGNSIGTTKSGTNLTWQDATLLNGLDDPYVDFRCNGGPIVIEPGEIERMVIGQGGVPQLSLPGKVSLTGGPLEIGDADPANRGMLRGFANAFGAYTYANASTYETWDFNLDGATTPAQFLAILNDNDINPRFRTLENMFGGFNISASPNSNLAVSFPFAFGEYDFHGVVVQDTGIGSTCPLFKKTWSGNWSTADKALYAKAVTDNGASWVFQFKVGAVASYSASTTIYEGKLNRIKDESGNLLGPIGECPMMYIPAGWDGAVGDIFIVPQNRAAWTPTLTTERPISSVDTIWVLDGVETRIEGGWEVVGAWDDLTASEDTAGRQGATIDRSGEFNVTITPTRRIVNLDLQYAIHEAASVSLYIDCYTRSTISGTTPARPYRFLMAVPSAKVYGPLYGTASGGRNRDESPRIVAGMPSVAGTYQGPYDAAALSFASHFHLWVENDVATL